MTRSTLALAPSSLAHDPIQESWENLPLADTVHRSKNNRAERLMAGVLITGFMTMMVIFGVTLTQAHQVMSKEAQAAELLMQAIHEPASLAAARLGSSSDTNPLKALGLEAQVSTQAGHRLITVPHAPLRIGAEVSNLMLKAPSGQVELRIDGGVIRKPANVMGYGSCDNEGPHCTPNEGTLTLTDAGAP